MHVDPRRLAPVSAAAPNGTATGSDNRRSLRIGVGGPVGTGKTALIAELCRQLSDRLQIVVVTNDIFTTEDAQALRRAGVLDPERIRPVETGCCPHTAIRDDIAANLDAVEGLEAAYRQTDLVLVESGGDNLTAIFSQALVDVQIFVIDVSGGEDIPRKGGPGITAADLLVINKTDLAPYVDVDLGVMEGDAAARRGDRPTVMIALTKPDGAQPVIDWIQTLLAARPTIAV